MFTLDGYVERVREAIQAGVSAYVVGGPSRREVEVIVADAIARFQHFQALRWELQEANARLAECKVIERANGFLMERRRMTEEEAYHCLRYMAMDRAEHLGELARRGLDRAELIA